MFTNICFFFLFFACCVLLIFVQKKQLVYDCVRNIQVSLAGELDFERFNFPDFVHSNEREQQQLGNKLFSSSSEKKKEWKPAELKFFILNWLNGFRNRISNKKKKERIFSATFGISTMSSFIHIWYTTVPNGKGMEKNGKCHS